MFGLSCEEFTGLASGAMENPVGFRNRLRMLWHKIQCVYCRHFSGQIQRIHKLLRGESKPKPMPPAMKSALRDKLRDVNN